MTEYSKLDPQYVKGVIKASGGEARRQTGQNFLVCPWVADEVKKITLENDAGNVTELGAGCGALTEMLLEVDKNVRAIEYDHWLAETLRNEQTRFPRKLKVEKGDLRKIKWTWTEPYQIVGNIPYNLSGLIVRKLTQLEPPPTQVVLIVQKEVGERLAARPPQMSLIGLAAQLWAEVKYVKTIPADCFWPAPKVMSAIIKLTPFLNNLPVSQRERILSLARICFQGKRKQLGGVLTRNLKVNHEKLDECMQKAGVSPTQRPQELTVEQWVSLEKHLV